MFNPLGLHLRLFAPFAGSGTWPVLPSSVKRWCEGAARYNTEGWKRNHIFFPFIRIFCLIEILRAGNLVRSLDAPFF